MSAHPAVPDWAVQGLQKELENVHSRVTRALGLSCEPPKIFIYPTVDALREHSCASRSAVAYYDGAIHLALIERDQVKYPVMKETFSIRDLSLSLTHEYVHHVLVSNGIGKPIWFQEGAAMELAHDQPSGYWAIWRAHPIDLRRMVDSFPNDGSLADPAAFYAQAYVMIEFLQRLCLALDGCGLRELTAALKSGRATPITLFDWAITERASDLIRTSRLPLWDDYVERGDFAPETLSALLARSRTR